MSLSPLSPSFAETRDALHQLAFFAVGPARHRSVGRMGLRDTTGGFGTPEYDGNVARIEGDQLVFEQNGNIATQSISTIRAATEFFGGEYQVDWFADFHDPLTPADPDTRLAIDRHSAIVIGDWFKLGFEILNELRAHGHEGDDVSEVQLWPEHFDPATELGDYDKGQRASFGASPGDGAHPEPYFYVASWSEIDRSNPYWNDESFNGASLSYEALTDSSDPTERALEFLLGGYRALHGS